jgi:hypothetical protein
MQICPFIRRNQSALAETERALVSPDAAAGGELISQRNLDKAVIFGFGNWGVLAPCACANCLETLPIPYNAHILTAVQAFELKNV